MRKRAEWSMPARTSKIFSQHPVLATRVPPAAVWSEVLQAWVIESKNMGWHPGNGRLKKLFRLSDILDYDLELREAFEAEDRCADTM